MEQAKFTQMKHGDAEDYAFLDGLERQYASGTVDRVLASLSGLENSFSGYRVSRLGHSLQTATRAWHDGADTDWVVAALLHDIGDPLAPYNHDEYAALVIRPFVREQVSWCVQTHAAFQLIYFGHFVGADQNKRDRHAGHPYYDDCVDFCERWDQASFDPDYPDLPLEFFEPMVREVFARTPYDPEVILPGTRVPLTDDATAESRQGLATRDELERELRHANG